MPSFMRKGSNQVNRRRYNLSLDSWYLRVPVAKADRHDDEFPGLTSIKYYRTYSYVTYGRPHTSRLEVKQQFTYWLDQIPSNRLLHHFHILAVVQVISYLGKQGLKARC